MVGGEHKPKRQEVATLDNGDNGDSEGSKERFPFKILAHCDECGWEWLEGRSTGVTNWNSMRNFCQEHTMKSVDNGGHASSSFGISGEVKKSWLEAKHDFKSETVEAFWTLGDSDFNIPTFTLTRVDS